MSVHIFKKIINRKQVCFNIELTYTYMLHEILHEVSLIKCKQHLINILPHQFNKELKESV